MPCRIEKLIKWLGGPGPHPADPAPIRTMMINMMGGKAPHQVADIVAAAVLVAVVDEPVVDPHTGVSIATTLGAAINPTKAEELAISSWRAIAIDLWLGDPDNARADPAKVRFLTAERDAHVKAITATGAVFVPPKPVVQKVFPPPIVEPKTTPPKFPVPVVDPKINVEPLPYDPNYPIDPDFPPGP